MPRWLIFTMVIQSLDPMVGENIRASKFRAAMKARSAGGQCINRQPQKAGGVDPPKMSAAGAQNGILYTKSGI